MELKILRGGRAIAFALIPFLCAHAAFAQSLRGVSLRGTLPAAVAGNGDSCGPILSADGRYVIFSSTADDLVRGTNGLALPQVWPRPLNVFVRDRVNQTTVLASVNASGAGGGNSNSLAAGISADGRYVLFQSVATNLFPGDTNRRSDVYVRDLVGGSNILVSVAMTGKSGYLGSRSPVMTPDGRYVAFASDVTNLVSGDGNYIGDIFRRDLWSDITVLVSAGARNTIPYIGYPQYTYPSSESPVISTNGRYVAFYSTATNLISGVTNQGEIYLRDIDAATTVWVSGYARATLPTKGPCFGHVLSLDGQFVAYEASLSDPAGTSRVSAVLRYNLATGLTDLISTNAYFPNQAPEDSRCLDMSRDGRFIAYIGNTNGNTGVTTCVQVWDAQTGATVLASGDLSNSVTDGSFCSTPVFNGDGQFVAFLSTATNMVAEMLPPGPHLYVRDLLSQTTSVVDEGAESSESTLDDTTVPQISDDGQFVAFDSRDAAFVAGDNNHASDVFVRDMAAETTELISVADTNGPLSQTPNASSTLALGGVSTDGRFVTFVSEASDLVEGDTNGMVDIFVRDFSTGTNILVNVGTNGSSADGRSMDPVISGNGRFVAFTSLADNLVPGDTNQVSDVFVRDLLLNETHLVSVSTNGVSQGDRASYSPAISDDGRFVFYRSLARNLATNSVWEGYELAIVRDTQLGTNYAFSSPSPLVTAGLSDGGRYVSYVTYVWPQLRNYIWDNQVGAVVYTNLLTTNSIVSADGSRLAYIDTTSKVGVLDRASNSNWTSTAFADVRRPSLRFSRDGRFLVCAGSTPRYWTVYLFDCIAQTNIIAGPANANRTASAGTADSPDISADGRFVAFRSAVTNIVSGQTNISPGIFAYDRVQNTTTLLTISAATGLPANDRSSRPVFSPDGSTLVFASWASDLGENDLNHACDIFAYHIFGSGEIPVFSTTVKRPPGGQGVVLTWPVVLGKSYRVEFKNSIDDPDWHEVSGVTVAGNQGVLTDAGGADGARFYRVVAY